jgi:hypothetical protein
VMVTLTAPSFGPVHRSGEAGRRCQCGQIHERDDPRQGAPLDPSRYRYMEQVIWNHYAPELWKRTVQSVRRGLAQALRTPRSRLPRVACIRFAKVAEFQRRGVVHYHAIIRIDGPAGADTPPPSVCTTGLLHDLVDAAADAAAVAIPASLRATADLNTAAELHWGQQLEIAALDHHTCTHAAGYIAKYATKAIEAATGGMLVKPVRSADRLDELPITEHARTLVGTAWTLGEQCGRPGLKRWAHQFGYGGHTLTKSRQYSTTFAALRAARTYWHRDTREAGNVIVRSQLTYTGRGYGHDRTLALRTPDARSVPTTPSKCQP